MRLDASELSYIDTRIPRNPTRFNLTDVCGFVRF